MKFSAFLASMAAIFSAQVANIDILISNACRVPEEGHLVSFTVGIPGQGAQGAYGDGTPDDSAIS